MELLARVLACAALASLTACEEPQIAQVQRQGWSIRLRYWGTWDRNWANEVSTRPDEREPWRVVFKSTDDDPMDPLEAITFISDDAAVILWRGVHLTTDRGRTWTRCGIAFDADRAVETAVTEFATVYRQVASLKDAGGRSVDVTFEWRRCGRNEPYPVAVIPPEQGTPRGVGSSDVLHPVAPVGPTRVGSPVRPTRPGGDHGSIQDVR